jgi:predicted PurR-regulated permease PerM
MTLQRQILFWCLAFAGFILVLYVLRDVLMPFMAGLVLAYLLDPLANRMEKLGVPRTVATLLILSAFVALFVLALVLLLPVLGNQLSGFIAKAPSYIQRLQQMLTEQGGPLLERFGGGPAILQDAQKSLGEVVSQGATWAARVLQSLWSGGQAIVDVISLMVITPVVAFYLIVDWNRMVAAIDSWLPRNQRAIIRALMAEMDAAIAGFLRGQSLVCLLLGIFYAVGLTLMGLSFGALIGMISGLMSFIPFVGSLIGLVLSVGVALVQFWPDWTMPALALGIFVAGQFIEGNILSPKLVGESVGLHPVWLMFALLAFGSLFGFLGLLVAVPLAAVVGVLTRFALRQYLASPLYGRAAPPVDTASSVDGGQSNV